MTAEVVIYDPSYYSKAQVDKMLEPVNPGRVSKLKKAKREFSYMEAYELRAALNRLLGFGRWSEDVIEQHLLYETQNESKAWTVAYRSLVRLTVCAPDGTRLATYTEGGTGEAVNQPSRGDAHNLALKTSQSDAFKRCCVNLGDYGGVSLYQGGRTKALVAKTLLYPFDGAPDVGALDDHVTEVVPEAEPEFEGSAEPEYETNAEETQLPAPPEVNDAVIAPFVQALLAGPDPDQPANIFYAKAQATAAKHGWLQVLVPNRDGTRVSTKALIDSELIENKRRSA